MKSGKLNDFLQRHFNVYNKSRPGLVVNDRGKTMLVGECTRTIPDDFVTYLRYDIYDAIYPLDDWNERAQSSMAPAMRLSSQDSS